MIYSQLKQGRSLAHIERSITIRIRRIAITATLLGMVVGCMAGAILHKRQVDPIIRESEKDRALLSQCRRDLYNAEEWQRHIIPRGGKK